MVPTHTRNPFGNATTHNTIQQADATTVKRAVSVSEYINQLVDEAPPLKPHIADRIAVLLRGDA